MDNSGKIQIEYKDINEYSQFINAAKRSLYGVDFFHASCLKYTAKTIAAWVQLSSNLFNLELGLPGLAQDQPPPYHLHPTAKVVDNLNKYNIRKTTVIHSRYPQR